MDLNPGKFYSGDIFANYYTSDTTYVFMSIVRSIKLKVYMTTFYKLESNS